ncbi:MAG: Smr/MutS family protein [Oligoflexales bacterium]|nr:Smr/MutS family protein [Oligoflexales bacterium]
MKEKKPSKRIHTKFELEDNAEELLLSHLENENIKPKDEIESVKKSLKGNRAEVVHIEIDLHGQTLDEAKRKVDRLFQKLLEKKGTLFEILIITGKGRHSSTEGGVLPGHIYNHTLRKYKDYVVCIDESPEQLKIDGLPIRGHFKVRIKA